jgi:aminobenzoyl-glutamate utilization protein B
MMRGVGSSLAVLALIGALLPLPANADERKQLAFDVVERNAEQMALLSDSIFCFGELGMQEFESTKLLKDTLEAAGFKVELVRSGGSCVINRCRKPSKPTTSC